VSLRVRLTRIARQDLAETRDYTEGTWGEAQWLRYFTAIAQALDRIAENPDCGQQRDRIGVGVRSLPVGKHLIFFAPFEGYEEVVVLRIVHQSRNLAGLRFLDDIDR
jgi:toxin ParE1/3/4